MKNESSSNVVNLKFNDQDEDMHDKNFKIKVKKIRMRKSCAGSKLDVVTRTSIVMTEAVTTLFPYIGSSLCSIFRALVELCKL